MKRVDAFCDSCDSEFGIELIDTEIKVRYCPICGEKLSDDIQEIDLDPEFMEEDWED